jgi:hypothetical protein
MGHNYRIRPLVVSKEWSTHNKLFVVSCRRQTKICREPSLKLTTHICRVDYLARGELIVYK